MNKKSEFVRNQLQYLLLQLEVNQLNSLLEFSSEILLLFAKYSFLFENSSDSINSCTADTSQFLMPQAFRERPVMFVDPDGLELTELEMMIAGPQSVSGYYLATHPDEAEALGEGAIDGFLGAINPVNWVKGIWETLIHPIKTYNSLIDSVKNTTDVIQNGSSVEQFELIGNFIGTEIGGYANCKFTAGLGKLKKVSAPTVNVGAGYLGVNPVSNDIILKKGLTWNEFQKATSGRKKTRQQVAEMYNSFEKGTISQILAGDETYAYRYWGGNAKEIGAYSLPPSMIGAGRETLALPTVWNDMTHLTLGQIKPGTTYFQGVIAPQLKYGPEFVGGGIQNLSFDFNPIIQIK